MKRPLAVRLLARFSGIASLLLLADASATSLRAQSTIYSSNPATETFKNVGVGFKMKVVSISGSNVTFQIDAQNNPFGEAGRAIVRRDSKTGTNVAETSSNYPAGATSAGTVTVNMNDLTSGSRNYYVVKRKTNGEVDTNVWDGPITITAHPPIQLPGPTISFSNVNSTGMTVNWSWSGNTANSSQIVFAALDDATGQALPGSPWYLSDTTTSRTLTDLSPGRQYKVSVNYLGEPGYVDGGSLAYRSTSNAIQLPAPTISFSNVSSTSMTVNWSWSGNTANSSQIVFAALDDTTGQALPGSPWYLSDTSTSKVLTGLSPGRQYKISVNYVGESGYIDGGSISYRTTSNAIQLPGPTISFSDVSSNSMTVNWTWSGSTSTASSITFSVREGDDGPALPGSPWTLAPTATSRPISGLSLGVNYKISVNYVGNPGYIDGGSVAYQTTLSPPNPLGIDTGILDGKKLGGIVQIGGFAVTAPGGNGWSRFYIRRNGENLAQAAGDFAVSNVNVGRLIWRDMDGLILASWADLFAGMGNGPFTLQVVGVPKSGTPVESAPFTVSLQSTLDLDITITPGTGSFPRYRMPTAPSQTTFNANFSGESGPVTIGWWGAAGFDEDGGASRSAVINDFGLNVVRAVVTDTENNRTVEAEVAPVAYRQPWGDPNQEDGGSSSIQGVDVVSGNLHLDFTDLTVPAIGVPFTLGRTYDTRPGQEPKWTLNFAEKLSHSHMNTHDFGEWQWPTVIHERDDGSIVTYFPNLDGTWLPATPGVHDQLVEDFEAGTFTIYTADTPPLVKVFEVVDPNTRANAEYRLKSIKTLRGHGLTVNYTAVGSTQISYVEDQSGRDYIFTYDGDKIRRVTDFSNRYVDYTWTGPNITSVRDVRGQTTHYDYPLNGNGAGRLNFIQYPRGNRPIGGIVYDDQERVVQITSPMGTNGDGSPVNSTTTFAYQPAFTDVLYPVAGNNLRFTLDANRNVVGITESYGAGNRTTSLQRLDRAALGGNALARANELGLTSSIIEPGSAAVTYTYASNGRGLVTQSTGASGPTWINYPPAVVNAAPGKLLRNLALPDSVTDPTQNTFPIQFEFGTGEFKGLLNPLGQGGKVLAFDPATGLPSRIDDGRGNETELFYTDKGDLERIRVPVDPDNANRDIIYTYPSGNNNRGLPASVTDRKGYRTEYVWDAAGNPTTIRVFGLPGDGEITMGYDDNGNRISVSDRRNQTTYFDFDAMDRPWRVRQPSPDGAQPQPTSTTAYDMLGRAYRTTDPNGNILEQTFGSTDNGAGLPETTRAWNPSTSSWDPLRQVTYLADGRIASVTDGEGVTRDYIYHSPPRQHLVHQIREPAPGGFRNFKEFDYDASERLTRETTGTTGSQPGNLPTKLFDYDAAGRLHRVCDVMDGDYSPAAWGKGTNLIVKVEYWGDDNIRTITDPLNQSTHLAYDAQGRLFSRQDSTNNIWGYRYDGNGNLHREIFPGGRTIVRNFGVLDRLESINYGDDLNTSVTYSYDANLNRTRMVDRHGVSDYTYDYLNRLTGFSRTPSGRPAAALAYTHEPAGQVKSITYPGNRVVNYTYDHMGRMKTVTPWTGGTFVYGWRKDGKVDFITNPNSTSTDYQYSDPAGRLSRIVTYTNGATVQHDYTWSPAGNLVGITGDQPTANPADANVTMNVSANRLSTLNGQSVTNDAAGRTLSLPSPVSASLSYEGLDWLASVTRGPQTINYGYDGDGVRIRRATGSATTRYLTAPGGDMPTVMAECDEANAPFRFHIYGAEGLLATADANGGYVVPHFSHRGDTMALTRGNSAWSSSVPVGGILESFGYSPYGVTAASNSGSNYPFRFIGQHGVMDEGNGLHFMRARYYSASIARFLSMDQLPGSVTEAQTMNRFGYVSGNPFGLIDASGLSSSPLKDMKILYTEYGSDIIEIATDRSPLNVAVKLATRKEVSQGMAHFYAGADLLAQTLANPIRKKIGKAPLTRTYKEFVEENYIRNVKISESVENIYDYAMVIESASSIVRNHSKLRKTRRILEKRKLRNDIIKEQFSINKALFDTLVK